LSDVRQAEVLFDLRNSACGLFKAVTAELLVLARGSFRQML